jgi:hypothetical protein
MPALTNRRRELFCQSRASGVTLKESAIAAGYTPRRAGVTGSELGRIRSIAVRICELREFFAESAARFTSYGMREAMCEASEAMQIAKAKGNASAMVAAITLKARLAGLLVERTNVTYTSVDELTDSQLESLIADAEGSGDTDGLTH